MKTLLNYCYVHLTETIEEMELAIKSLTEPQKKEVNQLISKKYGERHPNLKKNILLIVEHKHESKWTDKLTEEEADAANDSGSKAVKDIWSIVNIFKSTK